MNKIIKVCDNRELFIYSNDESYIFDNFFGVVGEDNATIVSFVFPEIINGYDVNNLSKKLCFINSEGTLKPDIVDNTLTIPFAMTGYPTAKIWIEMYSDSGELIWFSLEKEILFAEHSDDSIIHIGERDRTQLANALSNILGTETDSEHYDNITFPDFSEMTYAQLIAYIDNLRKFFELSLQRVRLIDETPSEDKIDTTMSELWDFSTDKLSNLRQVLLESYREANGWTTEQLNADTFIQSILNTDFESWSDFDLWLENICVHINAIATQELKSSMIEMLNQAAMYINNQAAPSDDEIGYYAVPLTLLSEDMTDEELSAAINSNFQKMGNTTKYYLGVQDYLDQMKIVLDRETTIGGDSDRDVRQLAYGILQGIQSLDNLYWTLRGQLIGIYDFEDEDDGGFHLDSASSDSDIVSAVSQTLSDYDELLSGMEEILGITTEVSDDE